MAVKVNPDEQSVDVSAFGQKIFGDLQVHKPWEHETFIDHVREIAARFNAMPTVSAVVYEGIIDDKVILIDIVSEADGSLATIACHADDPQGLIHSLVQLADGKAAQLKTLEAVHQKVDKAITFTALNTGISTIFGILNFTALPSAQEQEITGLAVAGG